MDHIKMTKTSEANSSKKSNENKVNIKVVEQKKNHLGS